MTYHVGGLAAVREELAPDASEPRLRERLGVTAPDTVALARALAAARRMRAELFDADLFGEPAWDLLLDLYVDTCEGVTTPVAHASLAPGVPASVTLRWIKELETRGLLLRWTSDDGRRDTVTLSRKAEHSMETLLRAVAGG